jgi:hypothetical protein
MQEQIGTIYVMPVTAAIFPVAAPAHGLKLAPYPRILNRSFE